MICIHNYTIIQGILNALKISHVLPFLPPHFIYQDFTWGHSQPVLGNRLGFCTQSMISTSKAISLARSFPFYGRDVATPDHVVCLSAQGILALVLQVPFGMLGIKPGLAVCMESALPTVLSP